MTRRASVVRAVVVALALAGALVAAPAADGAVVAGTPGVSLAPSVAVDAGGDAIVAWTTTFGSPPNTVDTVQYCVLPVAATACTHSGTLTAADSRTHIDGVQAIADGGTIVLLADVFGTVSPSSGDFTPLQEWISTDGGATFSIADGGISVSTGIINADTVPRGGVVAPGTGVLGFGWQTVAGPPTFNAFPLASPPECSIATCPAGFATLEPSTNPDQLSNGSGQFASVSDGPNAGVMGVFATEFTTGPLGCTPSGVAVFGVAFVFGSGDQSPSNSYNVSPGQPNTAWRVPVTQLDCGVENPAVGAGPSGYGVLEDDTQTATTVYHRFDLATDKFDTPLVTVAPASEVDPSVEQDGSGNLYATYLAGGAGGPIDLSYSADGGASFIGPGVLDPDTDQAATDVTSAVGATGQGWAAWLDGGSVLATPFSAVNATPPPAPPAPPVTSPPIPKVTTIATEQTHGSTSGTSLTIAAADTGERDQATIHGANASGATGTVTYGLYSSASCASSSEVFHGGTSTVTGGVGARSKAVPGVLAPGHYYWRVSYSGNPANLASTSSCTAERLTVSPPVTIGSPATSSSGAVTIPVTCPSASSCVISVSVTIRDGKKTVTLASGSFTISGRHAKRLTLHLTKAGRSRFAKHHGKLKATVVISARVAHHIIKTSRSVTFKHGH